MPYQVRLTPKAAKLHQKLNAQLNPKQQEIITEKLLLLEKNPHPDPPLKKKLTGNNPHKLHRLKVPPVRYIYRILEQEKIVEIIHVAKHKENYPFTTTPYRRRCISWEASAAY